MAEQPTKLPQWATNALTTVEPSAGEKAAGYVVATKPAARKLNWLLNNLYTWMQYLQTPVGTGAGPGIAATGGSSSGPGIRGTGGATSGAGVQGVGTGSGAGVSATGGGSNGAGVIGTANGTGDGVSGTSPSGIGVDGTGGTFGVRGEGSSNGVVGNGLTNGRGVWGVGAGTGSGVRGEAGGTGYGVEAIGDGTSPVRASLLVGPQDTDPTTATKGSVFPHTTGGRFRTYDGNGWTGLVHNVANAAPSTQINNTTTETVFSTGSYTIPANSLKVGDSIRVKAGGNASLSGGGTYDLKVRLGGVSGAILFQKTGMNNTEDGFWTIDLHHRVSSIGAAGIQYASGSIVYGYLASPPLVSPWVTTAGVTVDTTGSLDLVVTVDFSVASAGNNAQLYNFMVDIAG